MQFLKTLFWVLIAVIVALFASRNWADVTLNLWGDIQADIKLPLLLLIVFLLGFLPTWLIHARADLVAQPPARSARAQSVEPVATAEPVPERRGAGHMKPIFVAIDTPDVHRAAADIADAVRGHAGGVKLGLEFFLRQRARRRAAHRRARAAGLPRPQASRHPEHGRQGGPGARACSSRRS